jgi:hypothetical protein
MELLFLDWLTLADQPPPPPSTPHPQPPSRPPVPSPPSLIDSFSNIDVVKLAYGLAAGFLVRFTCASSHIQGLSVILAVASIVMRRVRGTTYTDMSAIVTRGGDSSDDVALDVKA